ncbi:MAG: SDR family oxidoreductase [SAR324 cluster bacterium]|nr:SDR family oxidoreductase [SAR324 cluster bacterium]
MSPKTVLITGCSSGIGYDAAVTLQQRGHTVIATARQTQDVEQLRKEGLTSFQLDLADSNSIRSGFEQTLEHTGGRLDVLFNNGAYAQPGAVEDLSRDVLRKQFETNLFGWHELTNLVIPVMRKQGSGRILQNSSILGFIALKHRGAYVASKFALEGLTDTLRLELEGTGIHLALIEPGPILTQMRPNSLKAFEENIDVESSVHRSHYEKTLARLRKEGAAQPFTLPPSAVTKRVIHAIENPVPQIRYPVTFPTYLFAVLTRILPDRLLDRLLTKTS